MSIRTQLPKLLAVVGPTASGKTDLAIALARQFDGEVVSADSRQLYRGMRVGAGVAEGEWKRVGKRRMYVAGGVPHHMVLLYSPARPLTLTQFRKAALWHVRDVIRRGKLPILVGGTGLYVSAVIDNFLVPAVPPNLDFRAIAERRSVESLFGELVEKDPDYAARISPSNRRYVTRALEVHAATGKPFSAQQKLGPARFDALILGVDRPADERDTAITNRVHAMATTGLVPEVRRLAKRYGWDVAPMNGIGYRQLRPHIEEGKPLEPCLAQVITDTRHYAKRQLTWWKRDSRVRWIANAREAEKLVNSWVSQN
jgi:tRNA dimethylallyltransferase